MKIFALAIATAATLLFQNPQMVNAFGGNQGDSATGRQFSNGGSIMPELGTRQPCDNRW